MGEAPVVARVVREFGDLRIATTDWPIILMDIPENRIADAELQAGLAYIEQILRECEKNHEKCAQITDMTRIHQLPPASQRKYAGDWVRDTAELQKATSVGGANITPSAILRGIITAIHWISKPPTPVAFFATRNEAMLQVVAWLDEARVPLPANLHSLRDALALQPKARREKQPSGWSWRR
jgi:hypothetical protein